MWIKDRHTTWKRIPLLSGGDRFVTEGVRFQLCGELTCRHCSGG
nr:MAG TPA: hypothetical protein [Caudoviricetes sp.]